MYWSGSMDWSWWHERRIARIDHRARCLACAGVGNLSVTSGQYVQNNQTGADLGLYFYRAGAVLQLDQVNDGQRQVASTILVFNIIYIIILKHPARERTCPTN